MRSTRLAADARLQRWYSFEDNDHLNDPRFSQVLFYAVSPGTDHARARVDGRPAGRQRQQLKSHSCALPGRRKLPAEVESQRRLDWQVRCPQLLSVSGPESTQIWAVSADKSLP